MSQPRSMPQPRTSSARPSPAPSAPSSQQNDPKRRRPENPSNIVYSQPADTGSGRNLMTQVTYAIEHLKDRDRSITFKEIVRYLSLSDLDDKALSSLEGVLKTHAKIEYHRGDKDGAKGTGTFRFRPTHGVRSADELEGYLQRQQTAQGIQVRELREGWPGAVAAIDELESQGRILVTRHKKDGSPRMVWQNDPSLIHHVDPEFQDLWHKVPAPHGLAELRNALIEFGLTPTSQVKAAPAVKKQEKKKRAPRRGGKVTNSHITGILKDYSNLRPGGGK